MGPAVKILGALIPLLGLVGSARAVVPERFLSGQDPRFPPAEFVVGTGQGDSREAAIASAFGSISLQLEPRGKIALIDRQFAQSESRPGLGDQHEGQTVERELKVEGDLQTCTHLCRVVETHSEGGKVFIFAVLHRAEGAARLRAAAAAALSEVGQLETQFGKALDSGRESEAAAVFQVMKSVVAGAGTNLARAWLLEGAAMPSTPDAQARRIVAQAKAALVERWHGREIEICIETTGDSPRGDRVRNRVAELFTVRGLVPRICGYDDDDGGSPLRFTARMRLQSTVEVGGTVGQRFVCRPTGQLKVTGDEGALTLASTELGGDAVAGSGGSLTEALDAALALVDARVENTIVETVGF